MGIVAGTAAAKALAGVTTSIFLLAPVAGAAAIGGGVGAAVVVGYLAGYLASKTEKKTEKED